MPALLPLATALLLASAPSDAPLIDVEVLQPAPSESTSRTAPSAADHADRYNLITLGGQAFVSSATLTLLGGAVVATEVLAMVGAAFLGSFGAWMTSTRLNGWLSAVGVVGVGFLVANTALFPLVGALAIDWLGEWSQPQWLWRLGPTYLAGLVTCAAMTAITVGLLYVSTGGAALIALAATPLVMGLVQTWAANAYKKPPRVGVVPLLGGERSRLTGGAAVWAAAF